MMTYLIIDVFLIEYVFLCSSKTKPQQKKTTIRVEWPGKENQAAQPKGYVYIIFESEKQVRELLNACTIQDGNDANSGNYYFKISSKRIKAKEVLINIKIYSYFPFHLIVLFDRLRMWYS